MRKLIVLLLTLALLPLAGAAESPKGNIPDRFTLTPDPEFRSLEDKVKSLKQDVIDLSTDLYKLQESLLTPSSTQVNFYVSVDGLSDLSLDSVELKVDNRTVKNYIYTAREQAALRRGGVQQLFAGNLPIGTHRFAATFASTNAAGKVSRGSVSGQFDKELAPKHIEMKFVADKGGEPRVELKEWE
ncbi:MAG TPA: AraC family transcriptional regulator [Gammaproteobacteria bacterium]|nr:AraC family transcriptional regulator [Gammaproteobacteria bacterium]